MERRALPPYGEFAMKKITIGHVDEVNASSTLVILACIQRESIVLCGEMDTRQLEFILADSERGRV